MSSIHLAFSSEHTPLALMANGSQGTIVGVHGESDARVERLLALGVTPGAVVVVLQTFPAVVFLCDQTELAVERVVAESIIVARKT